LSFSARRIKDFETLPSLIFGYDMPPEILRAFSFEKKLEESTGFLVKQGMATGDNERFLRLHFEVPLSRTQDSWPTYAKGGDFSMFHSDLPLVVDWRKDGHEIKERAAKEYGSETRTVKNQETYFQSGLTFSLVSQAGFSVRSLPAGCIYDMGGPSVFLNKSVSHWTALSMLSFLNSTPIQYILQFITDSRHWHVITIQSLPVPKLSTLSHEKLGHASYEIAKLAKKISASEEGTRLFSCPFLINPNGYSLHSIVTKHITIAKEIEKRFRILMPGIDVSVCEAYGIESNNITNLQTERIERAKETLLSTPVLVEEEFVHSVISWCMGVSLGVWSVNLARFFQEENEASFDPFAALPKYPPGMLQGPDGLPAKPEDVSSDYPVRIDWDGILVDDPEREDNIVRRVREVIEAIWKDRAEAIEKETCEILGIRDLRDYFRKPGNGGFWMDHVKRYSKSHRKAPIYWYLRSAKGNYGLWLYYHRLDKDILFKALLNYVEPKIRLEEDRLKTLRTRKEAAGSSGREAKQIEKDMDRQEQFVSELLDLKDKLRRAADFHLNPDLNDGVVLNIAPLWELVPWKEAKEYWEKLVEGKYEWSSIGKQLRERGVVKN